MNQTPKNYVLDRHLVERLEDQARSTGKTPDELVAEALRRFLRVDRENLTTYLRLRRRF